MNGASYMTHHEIKDVSRVKYNNEIYEKDHFSQKNQNPITCMQYKNSKSLGKNIDNPSIQIYIFSLKLLFVTIIKMFSQ